MAFKPEKIIALTRHPKAHDVLELRAQGETPYNIRVKLGLSEDEINQIMRHRSFRNYVRKYADMITEKALAESEVPDFENITDVGDIRKAFEKFSPEALRKLIVIMRSATSMKDQKDAAIEILDRAGYVKVQKQISVHADAEAIIRELNKQANEAIEPPTMEAQVIDDDQADEESISALEEALSKKDG